MVRMETIHGFPPLAREDACLLILGSMPGKRSLAEQRYYAHPQNAFWKITGELFQFDAQAPYHLRTNSLKDSGVALWDVMAACSRESSLDSDIVESTIVANDFNRFFTGHPEIKAVFFNGLKAAQAYRKFVQPRLRPASVLPTSRLPSSSPAHASMTFAKKLEAWRIISAQK